MAMRGTAPNWVREVFMLISSPGLLDNEGDCTAKTALAERKRTPVITMESSLSSALQCDLRLCYFPFVPRQSVINGESAGSTCTLPLLREC
jgi:hypothetical protein